MDAQINFNEFVAIANFENYSVNRLGVIINNTTNAVMKTSFNDANYLQVTLYNSRENQTFLVHRIVAQTFIENPDNLPEVDHKDRNKTNNNVSNLHWVTRSENNFNRELSHTEIVEEIPIHAREVIMINNQEFENLFYYDRAFYKDFGSYVKKYYIQRYQNRRYWQIYNRNNRQIQFSLRQFLREYSEFELDFPTEFN